PDAPVPPHSELLPVLDYRPTPLFIVGDTLDRYTHLISHSQPHLHEHHVQELEGGGQPAGV
ncbi:cytochrome P450, partial [Streptomyces sp. BE20]|nr:cytochrome P450 [Streptomyces sp. BE20]